MSCQFTHNALSINDVIFIDALAKDSEYALSSFSIISSYDKLVCKHISHVEFGSWVSIGCARVSTQTYLLQRFAYMLQLADLCRDLWQLIFGGRLWQARLPNCFLITDANAHQADLYDWQFITVTNGGRCPAKNRSNSIASCGNYPRTSAGQNLLAKTTAQRQISCPAHQPTFEDSASQNAGYNSARPAKWPLANCSQAPGHTPHADRLRPSARYMFITASALSPRAAQTLIKLNCGSRSSLRSSCAASLELTFPTWQPVYCFQYPSLQPKLL